MCPGICGFWYCLGERDFDRLYNFDMYSEKDTFKKTMKKMNK